MELAFTSPSPHISPPPPLPPPYDCLHIMSYPILWRYNLLHSQYPRICDHAQQPQHLSAPARWYLLGTTASGLDFIISERLFVIEPQEVWWIWKDLKAFGWHNKFWNLAGGIGFTVSVIFYAKSASCIVSYYHPAVTRSLFLIGSIAWCESLQKISREEGVTLWGDINRNVNDKH